ncbi:DUF2637 domain-containing protein [Streptomyces collinus]|uniref:DUF2637 domain-containing protein n=1 Tax=Streptomyces collinus TaxID=42684 RepID=UPI00397F1A50
MYDERTGHYQGFPTGFPTDYPDGYEVDGTLYQAQDGMIYPPLTPPDSGWDPAEELAFMLRDAIEEQPRIPAARTGEPADPVSHRDALVEITAELPPVRGGARAARGHRKVRERRRLNKIRTASYCIAAMACVVASAVSVFGGLVAYDPLRFVATGRTGSGAVSWWPLLVFGPWLVGSLSILRAALHQRRALHSWCVVLLFSSIAMALCVAEAPDNILDRAAAALPSFATLVCFQQLVRQITLTRPPRRARRQHRTRPAAPVSGGGPARQRTPRDRPPPASGGSAARRGQGRPAR